MSYPEEPLGPALVIQHTGQVFPLTEAPVTIGRAEENLIILDDPQVPLPTCYHSIAQIRVQVYGFVRDF